MNNCCRVHKYGNKTIFADVLKDHPKREILGQHTSTITQHKRHG